MALTCSIFGGFDRLNELNVCFQGENQLTCAMFQTVIAFEITLMLASSRYGE